MKRKTPADGIETTAPQGEARRPWVRPEIQEIDIDYVTRFPAYTSGPEVFNTGHS